MHGNKGKKRTRKQRENISKSKKGENHPNWGKHLTKETKDKISKAQKDIPRKPLSEEHKKNIRKGLLGKKWSWSAPKITKPLYKTYNPQISYAESTRQKDEFIEVKCAYCGKWFIPKIWAIRNRIYALIGTKGYKGENRLYCSTECKKECPIFWQQKWPKGFKPATSREVQPELRQMCFERDNYICQKCGKAQNELNVGLQCHHIEGIRWEPLESADLDKVITFCKNCHIEVHKQPDCGYHDLRCE